MDFWRNAPDEWDDPSNDGGPIAWAVIMAVLLIVVLVRMLS